MITLEDFKPHAFVENGFINDTLHLMIQLPTGHYLDKAEIAQGASGKNQNSSVIEVLLKNSGSSDKTGQLAITIKEKLFKRFGDSMRIDVKYPTIPAEGWVELFEL